MAGVTPESLVYLQTFVDRGLCVYTPHSVRLKAATDNMEGIADKARGKSMMSEFIRGSVSHRPLEGSNDSTAQNAFAPSQS
jgi:hypothetical protein